MRTIAGARPIRKLAAQSSPAGASALAETMRQDGRRRMAGRLPAHPERVTGRLLRDALPEGEPAVRDRLDQPLADPVDQRRLGAERLHPRAVILNPEFKGRGTNPSESSSATPLVLRSRYEPRAPRRSLCTPRGSRPLNLPPGAR